MTVQELIDALEEIENKNMTVCSYIFIPGTSELRGNPYHIVGIDIMSNRIDLDLGDVFYEKV